MRLERFRYCLPEGGRKSETKQKSLLKLFESRLRRAYLNRRDCLMKVSGTARRVNRRSPLIASLAFSLN